MSALTREQSLAAKPIAASILRREPMAGGSQRITIEVHPQGLLRWISRGRPVEHSYELDPLGLWVLDHCDGQKTVRYILQRFARDHQIDEHEAERAVLTFLRTLVSKGLVTLMVPRE
jgi:hypothetical protein